MNSKCAGLSAPAVTATPTEAPASRAHTRGTATAAGPGARSVVAPGTPGTAAKRISVSAPAAGKVPASDAVRPPARPVAPSNPITRSITDAGGSCPVAGQIAALAANLL